MADPPRKHFNWINVGYGDMSRKGSYPSSFLNILYQILHHGLPLSQTLFNSTSWANLSLIFAFRKGVVSSFKLPAAYLSPMKNNEDNNEQNTQELLFFCKTYKLGASGIVFRTICDLSNNLE